ncbi:UNVERIFIED_CONTAM: hypothetical protein PYX00_008340 [Menopon gallinae]|uniref:m7GpppN-mRNA hydrolase NUDT17 n=1 Tax=Menopon gallinae TaxID=328185 RepID=A0AAW2HMW1_9NEOP
MELLGKIWNLILKLLFKHSPECPIKIQSQLEIKSEEDDIKPEKKEQGIPVAVSVLVESSDRHILLTKRPSHMRSSPNVWVSPGGHLELSESLWEGGAREVEEETGLIVNVTEDDVLCLWENVYPLLLGLGPPTSHVLTVYFHVKMDETHDELQKLIKLDPQEVESNCWLSSCAVSNLIKLGKSEIQKQYALENDRLVEKELDMNNMFNRFLLQKRTPYSGTQYALRTWLEKCETNDGLFSKF